MEHTFIPMNAAYAHKIAYKWKYDGIYAFYDMTADEEDLLEFLDAAHWGERYFAVLDARNELTGYFSYSFEDGVMWIGFGLKPALTGKGLGASFVAEGIGFGVERFGYKQDCVMLAVASFNRRAIRAYEKLGFQSMGTYMQKTNGGEYEFVKMKKTL